jgi:hypothetical protein
LKSVFTGVTLTQPACEKLLNYNNFKALVMNQSDELCDAYDILADRVLAEQLKSMQVEKQKRLNKAALVVPCPNICINRKTGIVTHHFDRTKTISGTFNKRYLHPSDPNFVSYPYGYRCD